MLRHDELTTAVHDVITASSPKRQSAKQLPSFIPPAIIATIRENNRLRRGLFINRDPTNRIRFNLLQNWIGSELTVLRNTQWTDILESLSAKDQTLWKMTKRILRISDPNPPMQFAGG